MSDPVEQLSQLAREVTARVPKTITRDEMVLMLRLVDRIPRERPEFLDAADPALLTAFFAFRRRVGEIRVAVGA